MFIKDDDFSICLKRTQHIQTKYVIVEISGRQFWMKPDRWYDVNRIPAKVGRIITLNRVLLINHDWTHPVIIGKPYITTLLVTAEILRHLRGPKTIVYKMRPKKKTRKKQGHRQELTRIRLNYIGAKYKFHFN
jgi:large subunit ribosomal protein L21